MLVGKQGRGHQVTAEGLWSRYDIKPGQNHSTGKCLGKLNLIIRETKECKMFGDLAMNLLPGDYPEILQGTKRLIFPWFKVNSVNTHLPGLRIQQKSVSTSRGKGHEAKPGTAW